MYVCMTKFNRGSMPYLLKVFGWRRCGGCGAPWGSRWAPDAPSSLAGVHWGRGCCRLFSQDCPAAGDSRRHAPSPSTPQGALQPEDRGLQEDTGQRRRVLDILYDYIQIACVWGFLLMLVTLMKSMRSAYLPIVVPPANTQWKECM